MKKTQSVYVNVFLLHNWYWLLSHRSCCLAWYLYHTMLVKFYKILLKLDPDIKNSSVENLGIIWLSPFFFILFFGIFACKIFLFTKFTRIICKNAHTTHFRYFIWSVFIYTHTHSHQDYWGSDKTQTFLYLFCFSKSLTFRYQNCKIYLLKRATD